MTGQIVGTMYVVYEGRARWLATDDTAIVWVTAEWQEAIDQANAQQGVVYTYDVTAREEFINETCLYDGTPS